MKKKMLTLRQLKQVLRFSWVVWMLGLLLLSACAPIMQATSGAPEAANTPTPTNVVTAIPKATDTPAVTPSVVASPTGDKKPTSLPGESVVPAAAVSAQKVLSQKLGVTQEQVKILNAEAVDWNNGCLGVQMPGRMCTQMVTPGYKVMLESGGQQYEFHTNQAGSLVVDATAPLPRTADKVLVWEQTEGTACTRAEIGLKGVAVGPCSGTLEEKKLENGRAAELADLIKMYDRFFTETRAGTVQFNGDGTQQPTEAEMRSIGEWARLVAQEAQGGRSGAAWGLAMSWHREGGIAGLCNDLAIYANGWAVASTCKAGQARALPSYRLSADELAQLYTWVDQYKNFEYGQQDPAAADAMKISLVFTGQGAAEPTPEQKTPLADFAAQIYSEAAR